MLKIYFIRYFAKWINKNSGKIVIILYQNLTLKDKYRVAIIHCQEKLYHTVRKHQNLEILMIFYSSILLLLKKTEALMDVHVYLNITMATEENKLNSEQLGYNW